MKWKRGKKAQQEARLAQQQLKQQQQQSPGSHALNHRAPPGSSARLTPVPLVVARSDAAPAYQQTPRDFQLGAALADAGERRSSSASERVSSASPELGPDQQPGRSPASSPADEDTCWRSGSPSASCSPDTGQPAAQHSERDHQQADDGACSTGRHNR